MYKSTLNLSINLFKWDFRFAMQTARTVPGQKTIFSQIVAKSKTIPRLPNTRGNRRTQHEPNDVKQLCCVHSLIYAHLRTDTYTRTSNNSNSLHTPYRWTSCCAPNMCFIVNSFSVACLFSLSECHVDAH